MLYYITKKIRHKGKMESLPNDFLDILNKTALPHKNHLFQLLGYSLILEDIYGCTIDKGFIYLIPKEDAIVFDLSDALKNETKNMLNEIRDMISSQQIPKPAESIRKCSDCEYRNFCGDIF